jgi:hypothetical protein
MIKVYAKLNGVEYLLDSLDTGKEVVPMIAYYKRKGYTDFRIVD